MVAHIAAEVVKKAVEKAVKEGTKKGLKELPRAKDMKSGKLKKLDGNFSDGSLAKFNKGRKLETTKGEEKGHLQKTLQRSKDVPETDKSLGRFEGVVNKNDIAQTKGLDLNQSGLNGKDGLRKPKEVPESDHSLTKYNDVKQTNDKPLTNETEPGLRSRDVTKEVSRDTKETVDKMEKLEAKKETPTETAENYAKTANEGTETPNRELTEQEKQKLKEQLGWDDKQLAKCSIDNEGVIHYKTDRSDMNGKITEQGVKYESKTVEINGTKVEGVFPKFNSAFEVQLPKGIEKASNTTQFSECNRQLGEKIEKDPEYAKKFTKEQIEDIKAGQTPEGYTWHHNEEQGKMQLVNTVEHDRTQGGAAHTGGKTLWGGGYGNSAN